MMKRLLAIILCIALTATLAPVVRALPIQVENQSEDQCCHTLRVNPLDVNYVRPDYEGYLIDITPQRVADTFAYLDEFYVQKHPEAALRVYTGTEQDRENLKQLAQVITEGCTTDKQKADAIDAWLSRNILYEVNSSAYATDTFYRRSGNCLSYANLMQFLLRSLGIPAVVGDGWRGDMTTSTVDLFNYEGHAWCFVYLDGQWVLYDPLWLSGGTTDRDYMAQWIYFDTVEFVCPASDGDNLPPVAYDKSVPYYTDGKIYMYSRFLPQGAGTLSCFVNNQAYVFVSNQCQEDGIEDGWYYLDEGKTKEGMDRGEIYRDSWVSYGDYRQGEAMSLAYAFPNGMMPDGYVTHYDGKDWYMSYNCAMPILAAEEDYLIQDGLVTLKPGYTGEFLGLPWQDAVINPSDEDLIVTWSSWYPEVATVDQNGVITCHAEGYAEFEINLQRQEEDGSLTYLSTQFIQIFVSNEDRTPDYTDYKTHEHEFECVQTTEPDCDSWGYETYRCIHCPATTEVTTAPPLGHDFADHICTRCGVIDPEWLESLPHGTCGTNLTWVLTEDGTLTISGSGDMYEFSLEEDGMIYSPWIGLREQVLSVVVKPGVRSIGSAAFYDFPNLTDLSLPEGLLSIGDYAFAYCEALPTLTIPDGVLTIGKEALYNCYSLTYLNLPDSVSTLGGYALMGCAGLTAVNIPDSLTRIGDYTFACCSITSADIPEGVTVIGEHAFWGCEQMTQLTIPNTVTRIGPNAFRACTGLKNVRIPDSVKLIENEAFAICEGLETIDLGSGVTSIGTRAFYDCVGLKSVTLPASLKSLGDRVFEACLTLNSVTFLGSAPTVGQEPLMPYMEITIYYPANDPSWTAEEMQKYGQYKTWIPVGDPDMELGSGVCGNDVVWSLTADGTLTISRTGSANGLSVNATGTGAMYDFEYADTPWYAYSGMITDVRVEDGVTRIGVNAFRDLNNMRTVSLSSSIVEIGSWAFFQCSSLEAVTLPENLRSLEQECFNYCEKLQEIELPGSLTFIDSPFGYCTGLTRVVIHGDPDLPSFTISNSTFRCCTALEEIQVDEDHITLTAIDGVLYFRDADGLTLHQYPLGRKDASYTLAEGTYVIGQMSIEGSPYLEELILPETVKEIWPYAFSNCPELRALRFQGDAPAFMEGALTGLTANVYYPADNDTWTAEKLQNYGGDIDWVCARMNYVKWSSISTSLGGNIAMNFYVELSEDLVKDPNAYVRFTFAGRALDIPLSEGKESQKNGTTVYLFACPITSKNMTDEITAQVYNGSGAVGAAKSMSVDTYCNWVIANFKDEKTVNLMKGMLNYGASAQMLFNYRTDDLANAALSAADKALGAVDASAFIHSRTGEEAGIEPTSYTLLLDSETTVRCYFKLTGDKPIEDYTFTVDGVEVQPTYKDGKYYIERTGISAHRLDDMHVFTCGGITITYGGLSYVNQVMTYYTSGTTFDMASALFAYSKAAEAYIG